MKKLEKFLTSSLLGITLACGGEMAVPEPPEPQCYSQPVYFGKDSTQGVYSLDYIVTEDKMDWVFPENEIGKFDLNVFRYNSDARLNMNFGPMHDYRRNIVTGEFFASWYPYVNRNGEVLTAYTLTVEGTLQKNNQTEKWEIYVNVTETGLDPLFGVMPYTIKYEARGTKKPFEIDEDCPPSASIEDVPDTLSGIYDTTLEVTKDTADILAPEDKLINFDTQVFTLGNNAYIRTYIFGQRDHLRDLYTEEIRNKETGELCDEWEDPTLGIQLTFKICGKLTKHGELRVTGEVTPYIDGKYETVIYKIRGKKK